MGDVYMVNGKILSGLPNHAKDIEFDNTGTTLSSTNTEDAIKEVNSNLSVQTITGHASANITSIRFNGKKTGNVCEIEIVFDTDNALPIYHKIYTNLSVSASIVTYAMAFNGANYFPLNKGIYVTGNEIIAMDEIPAGTRVTCSLVFIGN